MHENLTVNERIRYLRKNELNMTLDKFGERLGVKKSALSLIESGKNNVTDQMFKAICREFNVNEEWLRYGVGDILVIPEDEDAALVSELLENPDNKHVKNLDNHYQVFYCYISNKSGPNLAYMLPIPYKYFPAYSGLT